MKNKLCNFTHLSSASIAFVLANQHVVGFELQASSAYEILAEFA